jgi:F-type H+-transporting ATPase subunit gamma
VSDTTASLARKIGGARDLQSVVRSMKALAASSIGAYERSVIALADYFHTVELGLRVCLHDSASLPEVKTTDGDWIAAVVFGSDQGLVGQFNEELVQFTRQTLAKKPVSPRIWAVGERVHTRLRDEGLAVRGLFPVPNSVKTITPLVGRILSDSEELGNAHELGELYLFYNRPQASVIYTPVSQRLLPLDESWRRELLCCAWPTGQLPEVIGGGTETLPALIREYLFVSLFRACAESLASENGARLAAMQRADKNIEELLENLGGKYHRLRQSGIDEELFDVIAGFEALLKQPPSK